ncbi:tetratricopeptide repeat protein [Methylobacterium sp. M6A4_1b]
MAENNEFIREVNEDYRRDQVAEIWRRYSGVIIALAILVVAAVGGWRYWQHDQRVRAEAASERFEIANRLAREGKSADADKAFEAIESDAPSGYALLARFRSATETAKRDPKAGAAEYDALANDTKVSTGLRDLARLRSALLRLDGTEPDAALATLQGLAAPNGPFRHTAREMLGLVALKRGDYDGAGRWFDQINADLQTPQNLRQRIEVYAALVAGGPVAVTAAAPAAPAAPPPVTR